MPDGIRCIYCHAVGFVRTHREMHGATAFTEFSCGQCNASWRVSGNPRELARAVADERNDPKRPKDDEK